MKCIFKSAGIIPILETIAKNTEFKIPYESGTTTTPHIWIISDDGIYLTPPVFNLKYPLSGGDICYAIGKGKGYHAGGDDYIEELTFDPIMLQKAKQGFDMVIDITATKMKISMVNPT